MLSIHRILRILAIGGLAGVTLVAKPAATLAADYDCSNCTKYASKGYCYAGQSTNITSVTGISGYITDPSASSIPDSNAHILLYNSIADSSNSSWLQTGMGMGTVGNQSNQTGNYEVYYENLQPDGTLIDNLYTHSQHPISQDSSYDAEVEYDGLVGHLGDPQFKAYVNGFLTGTGEITTSSGRAVSVAEIYADTNSCPTLTSGSPWQNFGTNASGTVTSNDEIYLATNYPESNWALWTGNPFIYTGVAGNPY